MAAQFYYWFTCLAFYLKDPFKKQMGLSIYLETSQVKTPYCKCLFTV